MRVTGCESALVPGVNCIGKSPTEPLSQVHVRARPDKLTAHTHVKHAGKGYPGTKRKIIMLLWVVGIYLGT